MARFPEAASVRLRAKDDHRDLRSALRQTQQRREAVASLRNESGLARLHVHVTLANELVRGMDVYGPAAGRRPVLLLLHHVRDAWLLRDERNEAGHVVGG